MILQVGSPTSYFDGGTHKTFLFKVLERGTVHQSRTKNCLFSGAVTKKMIYIYLSQLVFFELVEYL